LTGTYFAGAARKRVRAKLELAEKFINSEFYQKNKFRITRANDALSMISALLLILFAGGDQSSNAAAVRHMVSEIETTALLTGLHTGVYKVDKTVLKAISRVPRESYVGPGLINYAYLNVALPMEGHRHIMPEPFLSAMMVSLMDIDKDDRVLEIGFGSGYETAVMARLARQVYRIKQEHPVFTNKDDIKVKTLETRDYDNVQVRTGNGFYGWGKAAPFDAILIRQALKSPPPPLVKQLKDGGRIVMPIMEEGEINERLSVFVKGYDGTLDLAPFFDPVLMRVHP
jgi:protein-L-isoaspartate(D-aspartate) O-methyltransferase